jgi:transposase-like protein
MGRAGPGRGGTANPISFKRHRYPPDVIRYAVWLYFRFTLSIRDVEELLAQRAIEASREAVRCWVIKFGPLIAANLRRRRSASTGRWHLDERVVKISGRRMYLWRAVDDEGEMLDAPGLSPAFSLQPFRDLQHLQPPASHDLPTWPTNPAGPG